MSKKLYFFNNLAGMALKILIAKSLIIQDNKLIIKSFLFISYGAMLCQLVFQKYFELFSLKKERYNYG